MQYREIGTTDIRASVVGFGTFPLGGWLWGGVDEKASINVLRQAVDAGINLIDTAPMYGNGRAEEIVGKAIEGIRDKVVIASKCGVIWSKEDWPEGKGELFFYADENGVSFEGGKYRIYRYLNPDSIVREVEDSLRRLKTDYIDLLQTHQQESTTSIEDTMEVLEKLRKQGKIRAIGSSNVTPEQMERYCKAGKLDSTQEQFSYITRKAEENGIVDICKREKASFLAYTPLELGLLSGTIQPGAGFPEGDFRNHDPRFAPERIGKINSSLSKLEPIAQKHDINIGQLMLSWVVSRYEKSHVLCGMRNPKRIDENARAGDVILSEKDMNEMQELFDPAIIT